MVSERSRTMEKVTQFKNIKYTPEGNMGEVATITTLPVWNCYEQKWSSAPPVILRNALLFANHPQRQFCIGEIAEDTTNPSYLNPFQPPDHDKPFYLDMASGSRNHGRFTFTELLNKKLVAPSYFVTKPEDNWKRIIYGSILHTGCKKIVYLEMNYIVVDDENKDEEGNYLDDAINNIHWKTGDSHAKASKRLMQLLGLGDVDSGIVNEEIPLQFRASDWNKWIGKGTVAYNPLLDTYRNDFGSFDLVIPLSSLKGNKPPLGNHSGKLLLGLVFEAEERRAKPGWMLFQWFSFETLEKDNIISKMIKKCQKLATAYNSIQDLAKILRVEQESAELEVEENADVLQSNAEYVNTMMRIILNDKHGILLLHPYVVRRVKERMQSLWLNLAKSAGVRFYSLMAQPDESLAHYHVVTEDGRIIGRKVFCAPDFAEGEYIVFCNPMRHWGDCQLWGNRHEGNYINASGIMSAPRKLLLNLGRDTDGDFIQLIKSSAYPHIREAIMNFDEPPATKKFPKMALQGTLQEIAIRSMTDMTGIVASLLARARSAGAENIVLNIPAGGEQKEPEEMRIIDFLSQQVQIAVDSLKSAYPNNKNGLDAVKNYLDSLEASAPWLADFKTPDCYLNRTCAVIPDAEDTISRLVKLVNSYWKAPDLAIESSLRAYENVLFNDVIPADFQLNYALSHRTRYRQEMGKAIQWKNENEGDNRMIREVAEATKASKQIILEILSPEGKRYPYLTWVSAYWKVAHQAETGDAGLVFMIFNEEIIERLKEVEAPNYRLLKVYGCQHGSWSKPTHKWNGEEVQIRIYMTSLNGKQYIAVEMKWDKAQRLLGFHHLGLVGEKYRPLVQLGSTKTVRIYTERVAPDNSTASVALFDASMSQEEIDEYINFL